MAARALIAALLAVQLEERIAARFTRAQLAEFRGYLETLVDYLESDKA